MWSQNNPCSCYVHARLTLIKLLRNISCEWESLRMCTIQLSEWWPWWGFLLGRELDEYFGGELLYRLPSVLDLLLIAVLLIGHESDDVLSFHLCWCEVDLCWCVHAREKLLIDCVWLPEIQSPVSFNRLTMLTKLTKVWSKPVQAWHRFSLQSDRHLSPASRSACPLWWLVERSSEGLPDRTFGT